MSNITTSLTRQQWDEFDADDQKSIELAAANYQSAAVAARSAWTLFEENPDDYTPAEAKQLLSDRQLSVALTEHFSQQQVDRIKREKRERSFIEHKEDRAKALTAELDGKRAPRAGSIKSLTKYLSDLPGRLYAPTATTEDRSRLTEERNAKEAAIADADWQIAAAERQIEYFRQNPSHENWGRAVGSIAVIQFLTPGA